MNDDAISRLTMPMERLRHRAGPSLDRRASVKVLGAAGILSALAAPLSGAAKKGGRCRTKCKKTCALQNDACETFASGACSKLFPNDPACEDRFASCCASLSTCDAEAYFGCLEQQLPNPPPD